MCTETKPFFLPSRPSTPLHVRKTPRAAVPHCRLSHPNCSFTIIGWNCGPLDKAWLQAKRADRWEVGNEGRVWRCKMANVEVAIVWSTVALSCTLEATHLALAGRRMRGVHTNKCVCGPWMPNATLARPSPRTSFLPQSNSPSRPSTGCNGCSDGNPTGSSACQRLAHGAETFRAGYGKAALWSACWQGKQVSLLADNSPRPVANEDASHGVVCCLWSLLYGFGASAWTANE